MQSFLDGASEDVTAQRGKLFNLATRTYPCIVLGHETMPKQSHRIAFETGLIDDLVEYDKRIQWKSSAEYTTVCQCFVF